MNESQIVHESVLELEVLKILAPAPGEVFADLTLGHAGHAIRIMKEIGVDGHLFGWEKDPQMLTAARQRLEAVGGPLSSCTLIPSDHVDLSLICPTVIADLNFCGFDGCLLDLGPSTPQILDLERGMSWNSDLALNMKLDPGREGPSAETIVNEWPESDLAGIFYHHADERWSRRIAKKIVEVRSAEPIRTGRQLGEIVASAIPRRHWPPRIHPATRVFLGLRIEVNREYETLERVLPDAFEALSPGGRLAVISFHSGEDRRVKQFMKKITAPLRSPGPLPDPDTPPAALALTRKPIRPGPAEIERNPRSRSARLRAVMKNPEQA
jgi:16S rRNA (cytosine1402-N4)-methyltransferase